MSRIQDPKSRLSNLPTVICLLAICLLSFILRLFLLDAQSTWWDEAISLHLATSAVANLLADRVTHVHPPLYFLLLKGWIALAGTSAFSARFFSAWFNILLVPAVYAFGRRWLDRRTGLLASVLVAISPLYVVYSQEVRVYALLPLVYLAILALVNRLTTAPVRHETRNTKHEWLLLVGVEVVGLHLHYIVILAVAYANLLLLFRLRRRQRELRRWLVCMALVVILCLPWAIAVFLNRAAVLADIGADDPFTEPLPLGFFIRLLWTFQWSGLTAAPAYLPLQTMTLVLAGLLLIALISLLTSTRTCTTTTHLLAHWLVPLAPALLMWQAKELSHPRYVAIFAVAPLLLAGYALAQLRFAILHSPFSILHSLSGQVLAVLLGLTLCASSAIALHAWYFVPRFAKDDVRGMAAWLGTRTTADDLIVAPWQDWSLDYVYRGPASIVRPNPADEAVVWDILATRTGSARHVFLVDYYRGSQDRRGLIPFALESAGSLSERRSFKGLLVRLYTLDGPVEPLPQPVPTDAHFGPLWLTGAWLEPGPAADTALAVALHWRLEQPISGRYRVGLRLRDLDGWELSTADAWLLDSRALPTDRWIEGQEATTYHLLPLPPGTPPLTYTLAVGVYQIEGEAIRPLDLVDEAGNPRGQSYEAGAVTLAPARGLHTDPYSANLDLPLLPEPAVLADELLLEATTLDRQAAAPGQSLFVTLRWHAAAAPLPDLRPVLILSQAGTTLVAAESAPAGGRYPTDRWQAGEIVLEHRRLTIPPTAADGPAAVAIELGGRRVVLGSVEIAAGEHTFTPPPMAHEMPVRFGDVAELLGYDLAPGTHTSDQPVVLTLYWRALEGATSVDYAVFTHLLAADGHLVAQHDGPPAGGTRLTPGWLPGEVIVDQHEMTFREPYAGPACIEVGLYNPATLERVTTETGATFVLLPTPLTILEH